MTTKTQPDYQRIVRVTSLADFHQEVPTGLVRLSLTSTNVKSSVGLPTRSLMLSLQGVNAQGEIVWLAYGNTVVYAQSEPAFGRDKDIAAGMERMHEIVRAHLATLGYEVRDGDYGIPDGIKPLNAHFECARWRKDGERFVVEPVKEGDDD